MGYSLSFGKAQLVTQDKEDGEPTLYVDVHFPEPQFSYWTLSSSYSAWNDTMKLIPTLKKVWDRMEDHWQYYRGVIPVRLFEREIPAIEQEIAVTQNSTAQSQARWFCERAKKALANWGNHAAFDPPGEWSSRELMAAYQRGAKEAQAT